MAIKWFLKVPLGVLQFVCAVNEPKGPLRNLLENLSVLPSTYRFLTEPLRVNYNANSGFLKVPRSVLRKLAKKDSSE